MGQSLQILAGAHGASARRELPLRTTWTSHRTQGDRVSSPYQKSFHISTTPTTLGQKRRSPGSIPPRRVWKTQPHLLVADWMKLMEPARGESCPSGKRQGSAAPREDNIVSPDENSLHIFTTPTTRGRKQRSPGSIPPRAV